MALSWRHHALIQSLLSRGPLSEADFHSVFAGVSGKNPASNRQLFNDVLLKINKELSYVQFELRACMNQYDGMVYYGVVNNIADEESKLGTKYSAPQIAFYRGVLDAIVHDGGKEGSISNIDLLNVCLENQLPASQDTQGTQYQTPAAFRNFSFSQKERTVQELIQDRWLSLTSSGKIGLGIRSFFDLRSWFRSQDVPACEVCNEAGIKALTCPNDDCKVRIHDYCLKKKFPRRKSSRACPGCSTEWPRLEDAVEGDDEPDEPEPSQGTSTVSTRAAMRKVKAESAAANAANQSQGGSSSSGRQLRSSRTRGAEASQAPEDRPPAATRRQTRSCKAEADGAATTSIASSHPAMSTSASSQPVRSSKRRKAS